MNYYQFHIGDFRSGTVNMSRQARWIYRDMLDIYYDTESPLPADIDVLLDMLGIESQDEKAIVEKHLRFKFSESESGYTHEVCDKVITEYRAKAETARGNGRLGGRPKGKQNKPSGFQSGSDPVATANPVETGLKTNHKPLTNNQEPEVPPLIPQGEKKKRKVAIPNQFMVTAEMRTWAATSAPAVNLKTETENFVDYWRGAGGTKVDWVATWRTWMRKSQTDSQRGGGRGGYKSVNQQQVVEDNNARVVREIEEREAHKVSGSGEDLFNLGEPITIEGEFIHAT